MVHKTEQTLPRGRQRGCNSKTTSRFDAQRLFHPRYQGGGGGSLLFCLLKSSNCCLCDLLRFARGCCTSFISAALQRSSLSSPVLGCLGWIWLLQSAKQLFFSSVFCSPDLGYIRLGSLYLSGEGSNLRCSRNDVGLRMTHVDAEATERFPAATVPARGRSESPAGPHG